MWWKPDLAPLRCCCGLSSSSCSWTRQRPRGLHSHLTLLCMLSPAHLHCHVVHRLRLVIRDRMRWAITVTTSWRKAGTTSKKKKKAFCRSVSVLGCRVVNVHRQNIQAWCLFTEECRRQEADWYLALLISRALGEREEQKNLCLYHQPLFLLLSSDPCIMLSWKLSPLHQNLYTKARSYSHKTSKPQRFVILQSLLLYLVTEPTWCQQLREPVLWHIGAMSYMLTSTC